MQYEGTDDQRLVGFEVKLEFGFLPGFLLHWLDDNAVSLSMILLPAVPHNVGIVTGSSP